MKVCTIDMWGDWRRVLAGSSVFVTEAYGNVQEDQSWMSKNKQTNKQKTVFASNQDRYCSRCVSLLVPILCHHDGRSARPGDGLGSDPLVLESVTLVSMKTREKLRSWWLGAEFGFIMAMVWIFSMMNVIMFGSVTPLGTGHER